MQIKLMHSNAVLLSDTAHGVMAGEENEQLVLYNIGSVLMLRKRLNWRTE